MTERAGQACCIGVTDASMSKAAAAGRAMILPLALAQFSPDLQRIRGPYRFSAGIEAYGQHDTLQHGQPPIPAASGARKRTGSADGTTG
jgi:hypothetical protein